MTLKINDFADVSVGYTFRSAIDTTPTGNIRVLQAKNIKSGQPISELTGLEKIQPESISKATRLQLNDVVVVSRGMGAGSFKSTVFKSNEDNVIASSSIIIIHITENNIIPEYLSIYLNSEEGQRKIDQITTGSHFRTILRKNLDNLEIPAPSIEIQKTLIALHDNIKQQFSLLEKSREIKEILLNAAISR